MTQSNEAEALPIDSSTSTIVVFFASLWHTVVGAPKATNDKNKFSIYHYISATNNCTDNNFFKIPQQTNTCLCMPETQQ